MTLVDAKDLVQANRKDEEIRAIRWQLEAEQRAHAIADECVRDLMAKVAEANADRDRIRDASREMVAKYNRACAEIERLTKKLDELQGRGR